MIFSNINLRDELIRERRHQDNLLKDVQNLLCKEQQAEEDILSRLKQKNESDQLPVDFNENVFSLPEIKAVCIRYRLRFLDSGYFKSDYPLEAIMKIKDLEKKNSIKIPGFKIMAPANAFELENINKDPLLFAPLGNNKFLLIHKWGKDLKWYRRLLMWPFQNFKTLLLSILSCCIAFAFSIPGSAMSIFSTDAEIYLRLWLTVHSFIGLTGLVLWWGVSFDKTFSALNWNSKYYNY